MNPHKQGSFARCSPEEGGRGIWRRGGLWIALGLITVAPGCIQTEVELEPLRLPSQPLSMEAAVALALHNNPNIRISRQRVLQAGELVDQASSAYWPQVELGGTFTRTNRPAYVFSSILDQGEFDPSIDFNDPGTLSNIRPELGFGLHLYDGGRRKARVAGADAQFGAQLASEEALRSTVAFEVARAWYGVHSVQAAGRADQKAWDMSLTLLALGEEELAVGATLPTHVSHLGIQAADAERNLLDRELALQKAHNALRILLGLGVEQPLELAAPGPRRPTEIGELEELLIEARFGRPELVRAQREIEAAVAGVNAAEAGYFPELSLSGAFGFDDAKGRLRHSNWLFGAGLVQSITDVLRTPSRVRQAASELIIAHERGRGVLLEVENEVEAARLDAVQAHRNLALVRSDWVRKGKVLDLVRAESEAGSARPSELLGAELAQAQSEARMHVAELQDSLSRIALAHALGSFPLSGQVPVSQLGAEQNSIEDQP